MSRENGILKLSRQDRVKIKKLFNIVWCGTDPKRNLLLRNPYINVVNNFCLAVMSSRPHPYFSNYLVNNLSGIELYSGGFRGVYLKSPLFNNRGEKYYFTKTFKASYSSRKIFMFNINDHERDGWSSIVNWRERKFLNVTMIKYKHSNRFTINYQGTSNYLKDLVESDPIYFFKKIVWQTIS